MIISSAEMGPNVRSAIWVRPAVNATLPLPELFVNMVAMSFHLKCLDPDFWIILFLDKNPCRVNPCQNHGACSVRIVDQVPTAECECERSFVGNFCERGRGIF